MAKTMARIKDSVVVNLEWVDDRTVETDELKNIHDLRIRIGDVYDTKSFYRNGKKVLTAREQLRKNIDDYDNALTEIAMFLSAPMTIAEGMTPTVEERKQAILSSIDNLKYAIKSISEGGL